MPSTRCIPSLALKVNTQKMKSIEMIFVFISGSFFRSRNEIELYVVQGRITTGLAGAGSKNCKQFLLVLWITRRLWISQSGSGLPD